MPAAKRQLAAIMFTDIAGYTALMNENEAAAAVIRARHREVFQQGHGRYNGEIREMIGEVPEIDWDG